MNNYLTLFIRYKCINRINIITVSFNCIIPTKSTMLITNTKEIFLVFHQTKVI